MYVLLGGVIKLVLVGSVEALTDATVRPQSLHGSQQLVGERLRVLHARDHVQHQLRVGLDQHRVQLLYISQLYLFNTCLRDASTCDYRVLSEATLNYE